MSTSPDMLYHMGGVPVASDISQPGKPKWLYSSSTAQPYIELDKSQRNADLYSTLTTGHDALTTGRNDLLYVTPENHVITAAMDWTKSNSHARGMSPLVLGYNPSYFSHTVDTDVLFTVSGSNNTFTNLRWLHGHNSSTNAHCIELTGTNNSFYYCHFEGPEGAAEKAVSGYDIVKISGEYNYFNHCMFGNTWATMTDVCANVGFTGNTSPSTVFEDCVFQINAGAVGNLFLHVYQAMANGTHIHFRNCMFVNMGTTTMTYGVDGYGLSNAQSRMTFHNCSFTGCTDIVNATYEAKVFFGPGVYHANDQTTGLADNPNVS